MLPSLPSPSKPSPPTAEEIDKIYRESEAASSRSLRYYLQRIVIDSKPAPLPWIDLANQWQCDMMEQIIPAIEIATGHRPPQPGQPLCFWFTLPKGHDKTTAIGRLCNWIIAFSKNPVRIKVGSGDLAQANLTEQQMEIEAKLNPWLAKHLAFTRHHVSGPGGSLEILTSDVASSHGYIAEVYVCDEVTHWKNRGLMDSLIAARGKRDAVFIVICNAGFQRTWQHKMLKQVKASPRWFVYEAPGMVASWMNKEAIAEDRKLIPRSEARRLYDNQWIDASSEEAEWPEEYFPDSMWFDVWPKDLTVKVIMLDPSKGKDSKHGDYSAFVMLGHSTDGTLWADAVLKRCPITEIVDTGMDLYSHFQPDGFGVETNQFQELLAGEFIRVSKQRGVMLPIYEINNSVNKHVRIGRIGPFLAEKNIRFKANSPGAAMLVHQLRDFCPKGAEHDDGPDALEGAIRLARQLHNGRIRGGTISDKPYIIAA